MVNVRDVLVKPLITILPVDCDAAVASASVGRELYT